MKKVMTMKVMTMLAAAFIIAACGNDSLSIHSLCS